LLQPAADQSAAIDVDELAILFSELCSLLDARIKVSIKLGYLLKFEVKKEELTVACWSQKIADHQEVSPLGSQRMRLH
jgi:hypothetical protein